MGTTDSVPGLLTETQVMSCVTCTFLHILYDLLFHVADCQNKNHFTFCIGNHTVSSSIWN